MSFESIVAALATFGTALGLIVAIGIFLLAARFVRNARKGNREVREVRHDPHAGGDADDRRDIRQ